MSEDGVRIVSWRIVDKEKYNTLSDALSSTSEEFAEKVYEWDKNGRKTPLEIFNGDTREIWTTK